jgi:hypothetical protein
MLVNIIIVVDMNHRMRYYSGMAKTIRDQAQLRAHLESLRAKGETDRAFAQRLGIHWNTITKLKHGMNFDTPKSFRALNLSVQYEVMK